MSTYRQIPSSPPSGSSQDDLVDKTYSDDHTHGLTHKQRWQPSSIISRLSFAVCIICTIFNLSLAFFYKSTTSTVVQSASYASLRREDIANLRRPSQFIGFDQIQRQTPPLPRQFNNYPILLAQVDAADPDKVFEQDLRRYMAHVGTIEPEDKRVLVTQSVSHLNFIIYATNSS